MLLQTLRCEIFINLHRHINTHLHNALIAREPLDKNVKVTKGPIQMVKKENKKSKLKGVKGPGQCLVGEKIHGDLLSSKEWTAS